MPARGSYVRDVVVENGTLHDSAVEERSGGILDREEMADDVRSARRLAKEGDIRRVSPESTDKAIDPFERTDLIAQTVVTDALIACQSVVLTDGSTGSTAKQSETEADSLFRKKRRRRNAR